MKGLVETTNDGIFLVVKHGGIVQESKTQREGFSPIEVSNPRTGDTTIKYVKRYKKVIALVKKIEWYDREHDDARYMGWKLTLDDQDGTICTLDLPFESRVGTRFMKLAENIDYTQPVEFSAWRGPDDKIAFSVKQNEQNVSQKYTREDPGDCPPPVQGFNKKWNYDAQKEFLFERMKNVVIPKVQAVNALNEHHAPEDEESETEASSNGDSVEGGSLLDKIKTHLADYSTENGVTVTDAIEKFFKTRRWPDVEKLDHSVLVAKEKELADAVLPF